MEDIKKFGYAISNPPYQIENQSDDASRRTTSDVFPMFQEQASLISHRTTMVYPATWQKNPTINLGRFLRDNGLIRSDYRSSTDLFPGIRAGYPLSIVSTEKDYNGNVLINGISRLRDEEVWIDSIAKAILFDRTKNFKKLCGAVHLSKLSNIQDSGIVFKEDATVFQEPVSVYIKKKPGVQADGGYYFAEKAVFEKELFNPKTLEEYTVSIQSSPVGRMRIFNELLERKETLGAKVFGIDESHSLTWISLKSFDTEPEAENFAKYVNSFTFQLLTSFDFSRKTFASYVPDLEDYTDNNPDIKWKLPLDPQLYKLFDLTEEEIKVIEES